MKCSECEYGTYLPVLRGYSCKHKGSKHGLFKGKTKPHDCPINGGKKYLSHGNSTKLTIKVKGYYN